MAPRPCLPSLLVVASVLALCLGAAVEVKAAPPAFKGYWKTINKNVGIASHNTQLLPGTNKFLLLDRTDVKGQEIEIDGKPAHAVVYNLDTNKPTPIKLDSNTWCSAGSALADGSVFNIGGYNYPTGGGTQKVRQWAFQGNSLDEVDMLVSQRWYPTTQVLPDNRVIVVNGNKYGNGFNTDGSSNPTYEYYPNPGRKEYKSDFLERTLADNLYPFVTLMPNGDLFWFANRDAIQFSWKTNKEVRKYPRIPVGPRSYPSTAGYAFLPLDGHANYNRAEVIICGGADPIEPNYDFPLRPDQLNKPAYDSCARMNIMDKNPVWAVEDMPDSLLMPDGVILANGNILFVNGARTGHAGYYAARHPALEPFLYSPAAPKGQRFRVLAATGTARGYHSTANLAPDGSVFVAGSNARTNYDTGAKDFPTELSVESFFPPYFQVARPNFLAAPVTIAFGKRYSLSYGFGTKPFKSQPFLVAPDFHSHSNPMNMRALYLPAMAPTKAGATYTQVFTAPRDANVAPRGYYLLFVIVNGVPSRGRWVKVVAA